MSKRQRTGSMAMTTTSVKNGMIETGEVVPIPKDWNSVSVYQPDYFTVRLKYSDYYLLQNATGAVKFQTFNLNSIYDVDATGVGHQPNGRDRWASLYAYYRVLESKIKVHFLYDHGSNGAATKTDQDPIACGFYINPNSAFNPGQGGLSTYNNVMEARHSAFKVLTRENDHAYMEYTYKPQSMDGVISNDTQPQVWTAVGSSPNQVHLLDVFAQNRPFSGVYNPFSCQILVDIEYLVQWRDVSNKNEEFQAD